MNYAALPIQCGNHPLIPEVTIAEIYSHARIDGHSVKLVEQPEIAVTCATCGKVSFADKIVFEAKRTERTYQ